MDWKDELGTYLTSGNAYKLKYLNGKLIEYCREWSNYLSEFDKVITDCTLEYEKYISISAHNKNGKRLFEFKVQLYYRLSESRAELCLWIKYTDELQFMKFNDDGESMPYKWIEEEITDDCIYEKDFILQIISNRFISFDSKKYAGE